MMPEISIVMSAYNCEDTIVYAVESVLSQTFQDFEFIIIDDGSSDDTLKILSGFSDSRIKILRNTHDYIGSLNAGIRHSKGKYIARMDADDYMHPNRLLFQWTFMQSNSKIDICSTWMQTFGMFHGVISQSSGKHEDMLYKLLQGNIVCHPTVMMRNAKIRNSGLFYEAYALAEDYKLWFEATKRGLSFYTIPIVLYYYRISSRQQTIRHRDIQISTSRKIKEEILEYIVQCHEDGCIKAYLTEILNLYRRKYLTLEQSCNLFMSTNNIYRKHEKSLSV